MYMLIVLFTNKIDKYLVKAGYTENSMSTLDKLIASSSTAI